MTLRTEVYQFRECARSSPHFPATLPLTPTCMSNKPCLLYTIITAIGGNGVVVVVVVLINTIDNLLP